MAEFLMGLAVGMFTMWLLARWAHAPLREKAERILAEYVMAESDEETP